MTTLRDRIAGERRRLREVRQQLTAAIGQGAQANAEWVAFYIALGDYMEAAMARLHAQDEKMDTMIRDKLGELDTSAREALAELDERLSGNARRLGVLLETRDRLATEGTPALAAFETAAREFTDFIVANMGHHGGTTDLAAKLFNTADWEYMAGITDADLAREIELFDRVTTTRPADFKMPAVSA